MRAAPNPNPSQVSTAATSPELELIEQLKRQLAGPLFTAVSSRLESYQNRLQYAELKIRVLEERLRLTQILPESLRSRIPELTEDQLCGLRFASDAEIPKLVERALNEKLKRADIKKAIQNWRPDCWRV